MEEVRELPRDNSGLPEDHSSQEEETVAAEIEDLLRQGYSASQVVNEFGYARSSVNRIVKKLKKGKTVKGGNSKLPAALSPKQLIPPEIALQNIRLEDGRYKEGFTDGMAVLIMASRYNQILASLQAETLKSQLDVLKMAQGGTDAAIREVAGAFAQMSDQNKSEILQAVQRQTIQTSENPMQTMIQQTFAEFMQPMLQNILSKVIGGQPPMSGQPQPGPPPMSGEQQTEAVEHHSIDELEEED